MKTYHDGAQEERKAILRKVRRMLAKFWVGGLGHAPEEGVLNQLRFWISQRCERYRKRKGGL
jgi:hypothetical protein